MAGHLPHDSLPTDIVQTAPEEMDRGSVFADVTPDMLLYQGESFGPVCSVFEVRNDGEAIQIANDSEYGLTAGVMTGNE
jgi:acyl-CoA reductase-like NAD-dependent aldehyde dehydrogenase